jgi:hypothetical protein
MNGTYEERLSSTGNGACRINKDSWSIRYYFSGFDLIYNGAWVTIKGNDIEKYTSAYSSSNSPKK